MLVVTPVGPGNTLIVLPGIRDNAKPSRYRVRSQACRGAGYCLLAAQCGGTWKWQRLSDHPMYRF